MHITLNGDPASVSDTATVADLLPGGKAAGLAVAVNGTVVPRHRHAAHRLDAGDLVEIVTAVQGG